SCSVVQLNVGGHVFTASALRQHPDSQLTSMFSSGQQPKLPTNAKGRYFIDCHGTHFGAILQFLRTQRLPTESVLEVCVGESGPSGSHRRPSLCCHRVCSENLRRYDNAINNLEEQEVVQFGPWK
ncbi:unnamed protein product, partial [Coregonus sp. 'balchen']